jgi:hypothetical protein
MTSLMWRLCHGLLCRRAAAALAGQGQYNLPPFSLFLLDDSAALAQLAALRLPQARLVWLAELIAPERNIEVPAAWFLHCALGTCGAEIAAAQRKFLARGGLEGLLHRAGYCVQKRVPLWRGAAIAAQVLVPPA